MSYADMTPEDAAILLWRMAAIDTGNEYFQPNPDDRAFYLKNVFQRSDDFAIELIQAQCDAAVKRHMAGLWRPIEEAPEECRQVLFPNGELQCVVCHKEYGLPTHFIDLADLGQPGGEG